MQTTKFETLPRQHQNQQPGSQARMNPQPQYDCPDYRPAGKMAGMRAIVTGGDSGIGRSVALYYAKEGADVAILYLKENEDARQVQRDIEALGRRCYPIPADLRDEAQAAGAVERAVQLMGGLNVLVNNAGVQYPQNSILDIAREQLEDTFASNIFSQFYVTRAALPHMQRGACIINTASVTAFEGNPTLIDYSATKGAIVAFTRSMALSLMAQGIRVNCVAPGPVWTPLIPATFSSYDVSTFGSDYPMKRPAQPCELAPVYVFLACADSSDVSGQVFHVNSGKIVN